MRAERKDAQALIDCSFAAYEYKIEQEKYKNRSAKGSDLDGMPKQRGAVRGLEAGLISEMNAKEKLHEKHAAFLRAQRKALRALDRIVLYQPQQGEYIKGMRAFIRLYYIDDRPLKAACAEAGIHKRTAFRYKSAIYRAANGKSK